METAQYYLDNPEKIFLDLIYNKPSDFVERLSAIEISEEQVKRDFNTAVDKTWGTTVILGYRYKTSEVLKNLAVDFWNQVYFDWFDHNFVRFWILMSSRVYPQDRLLQLVEDRIAELSVDA